MWLLQRMGPHRSALFAARYAQGNTALARTSARSKGALRARAKMCAHNVGAVTAGEEMEAEMEDEVQTPAQDGVSEVEE